MCKGLEQKLGHKPMYGMWVAQALRCYKPEPPWHFLKTLHYAGLPIFVCVCVKINFFSFHVYELFEVHLYLKLVFDREDPSISEVKMDLKIILGDLEREEK